MIDTIRQLLETHFYTVFILGITVLAFLTLGIMLRNIKTSFVPLYFLVLLLAGFIYAIYNRYKYDGLAELILGIYLVIRSEEHTSELQSRPHLVCRLLL